MRRCCRPLSALRIRSARRRVACGAFALLFCSASTVSLQPTQVPSPATPDPDTGVQRIDRAVQARYQTVLSFTDIEHYAVFRGKDEIHPVAEMTVKDTYRKDVGKSYTVLSQSGSAFIFRIGLKPLLDNERSINLPGHVQQSWFDSGNYEMKPDGTAQIRGRNCIVVAVSAKRKAPNTINGNIWVDVNDFSLAQIDGIASKSPSPFAGTTHLMRQYAQIDGFPMAMHARAESSSLLFGRTVVTIDYSDYQLQLGPRR
jgi:hypothetical protein